jgi:hypothetical protein
MFKNKEKRERRVYMYYIPGEQSFVVGPRRDYAVCSNGKKGAVIEWLYIKRRGGGPLWCVYIFILFLYVVIWFFLYFFFLLNVSFGTSMGE